MTRSRSSCAAPSTAPDASVAARELRREDVLAANVALALRGRLDLLGSEELVLRASLDLDQRRWRAAGTGQQLQAGEG